MTEEPSPASFEKTPRLQPWVMTVLIAMPVTAPPTALTPNAKRKMDANTVPTSVMCAKNTISAPITYRTAMNGTSFSATAATLWRPPIMMIAAMIMSATPMMMLMTDMPPISGASTFGKNAEWMFSVILLI